ncbi:MAG: hypothetical protein LBL50_02765 [Candidatus Margulisbacteria bacterium]|jgi:hypothetical protein|nr:hypothetical protein [Candidatus Margulisiibacteriota bacterium]
MQRRLIAKRIERYKQPNVVRANDARLLRLAGFIAAKAELNGDRGYIPKAINNPRTLAERAETRAHDFYKGVKNGQIKLLPDRQAFFDRITDGVPEYYSWQVSRNIENLRIFIERYHFRPRQISGRKKAKLTELEQQEQFLGVFVNDVLTGSIKNMTAAQRQEFDAALKGAPLFEEYYLCIYGRPYYSGYGFIPANEI